MKNMVKKKTKMLKRKMINSAFLLIFSVIAITSYYTANFSRAKDIIEISVNIKNSLNHEQSEKYTVNATSGNDGESFYLKLPEYINNKKVVKYTYYLEKKSEVTTQEKDTEKNEENLETNEIENSVAPEIKVEENTIDNQVTENNTDEIASQDNLQQENTEQSNEKEEIQETTNVGLYDIGPNDILPENKIYLTTSEINNKELTILANYETKVKDNQILYYQKLERQENDTKITVTGYMPENAQLNVTEVDKKNAQDTIREQTSQPVILSVAYDIKIQIGEKIYEPYEIAEEVNVNIEKASLENKEVNVWHITNDNKAEKLENTQDANSTTVQTDEFSVFALEDVEATALAIDGMAENVLTIDDAESDKAYWIGRNYTDDVNGSSANRGTNQNVYTNFANVTINYYAYANGETDPEKVGYVSLTERYNVITYKKTVPILNGNISIELIDNPFIDRPTGYGFGGWVSTDGTITKDSKTNVQTITATGSSDMTLNIYTNWTVATVVYVNADRGGDTNSGLTPDKPVGSWGKALEIIRNNTSNANDRENNIIVMMSNMDTSINYTTPVTLQTTIIADVTYTSSTTFTSGGTYLLATGTGVGANAITVDGSSVENIQLSDYIDPGEESQWVITQSGSGYTIRNVATGQYLAYSYGLRMQNNSFTWEYSNRRFYYETGGWFGRTYYIRYNNGWTTTTSQSSGQQFYFLTYTAENHREDSVGIKGQTQNNSNYTSSRNVAFTLTGLYGHTDYSKNTTLTLTNTDYCNFSIYNDFQIEYINIYANGYTSDTSGTSAGSPYLYGNNNNVRIGRGMYPITNTSDTASTFRTVYGGSTSGTVGSTSNDNNAYKLVIESGKYSQIEGFHGSGSNSYYGTIYVTWGNDIDRAKGVNDQFKNYNRCTINRSSGINGKRDVNDPAFIITVKSGTFGYDFIEGHSTSQDIAYAGIYVGGHGTSASSGTRDISDRYIIVEGGNIANIIGGLKVTSGTDVDTRIYVKGGTVKNIVGGAGYSTTYEDRIIQVTGGKILYSISGGSNGVYATGSGSDGKIENCNTLVYIGGNAQIGDESTIGQELYGVEAGCVLGAGNGNSRVANSGQVNNSQIIIDQNAHILNSVYGGGNYGIVGPPNSTNATAKIDMLGGTVDKNIYGGANQNQIYGQTLINVKNGQVKGAIYGGSNTKGTISTTSTINVTGGTLGVDSNTTDNGVLFGGGYGSSTTISGNATVNILDTDQNVRIYGSAYGGSSLGRINGNTTVNIKDSESNANTISIKGFVFAGGKGNSGTAATIAGSSTLEVDGSNLPECSVFGGNDINGTTGGTITVNVGRTYQSTLLAAYGGGNMANISTSSPGVYVNLLSKANVTNAFNGGRAADLLSSGSNSTTRTIRLQGGHAENIFGGSDSSGTVTVSHVYIESGTATNVYGGNNIDGTTTTTNVSITGGTVTNVYGGGYQASTTASNVSLAGGTITNGFGGGNAANVTTSSITLQGSNAENIFGGSNQQGTVTNAYVTINSGTAKNVFGGNNAGGNTVTPEVVVKSTVENVYGGGNEAITTGNTSVKITNATITGSAYGGGNGAAAVVTGDSIITVEGTTTIAGNLFGGGNAAATGTETDNSVVRVYVTGATIGEDVYGAANTSVVNGETEVKIGTSAVNDPSLAQGNINIAGTVFGGGKSNSAGSEDYDFTFESVTGDVHIDIDATGYDNGTYTFTIGKSIFASGNAAKISGNGYITVKNYGSANNIKSNISIQRATQVTLDNCGIYFEGTTDRTNEISTAIYTFNRINELIIKNNTTLYLASGANILEKLTSVDGSNNKATVTISENGTINKNVDNRIYLLQGKNLILTTEAGAHGEVSGMTYIGLYKGTINRVTGIYSPDYENGDVIPEDEEEFARNSYVQAKHYESHDIKVDGFYTNFDKEGIINTQYITPTPENAVYYQWILGEITDDIYYEGIELIATKYDTTSTYVLSLDGLSFPNMNVEVVGFDTSDLQTDVIITDQADIPNIEMDPNKANKRFGLTMTAGNTGWQTNGTSEFFTTDDDMVGTYSGTTQYLSDNSTSTPTFSFYLAHSKNVSVNEVLGTVTIQLKVSYLENEEMVIRNVYIVLSLSTNNTFKLANDYYEGAITPGKEYSMFPSTTTSITSNSSLSAYYSLYLGDYSKDEEYYDDFVGYNHWLISSCVLPAETKITMIDRSASTVKYYYYIVTPEDETNGKLEYKFTDFTAMGSTNEKYNADQSYYNKDMDIVLEEFIFQVDFEDINLQNSLNNQTLIVQLRDMWDNTMKLTVNTEQYPMMFNLYSDKEALKSVDVNSNKTFIYMGDNFKFDLETKYEFQTENAEIIYDTTYFEDQLGVKITVLEGSTPLTSSELTGIYIEHNGIRYYARSDGSYRIKLADAVSNVLTDMIVYTTNGTLETATYTFQFETFGSLDGVYFSDAIATDSVNMQIINTDYGLAADLDDNSVLINGETGITQNNNNLLDFTVRYVAEFSNPKITISLYRRDYTNIYSSTYNLVDLADYVTNTLQTTSVEKEYLVTDNAQDTQQFTLNLKDNLTTGTYKIVFSLYDGENYIGNVDKMIIIK